MKNSRCVLWDGKYGIHFIAVDLFCLQIKTFCSVQISQPFIHRHSVGNCFCHLEERKLVINEKTEIYCKVKLNTDIKYNVVLFILLLRFNSLLNSQSLNEI